MSDKHDKKKHDRGDPPHEGSVSATDPELVAWLRTFWAREEYPQKIEVWQVFGRNGLDRGHRIFVEDFKAGKELNPEQVAKLANEIVAVAQHDSDCRGCASLYQIDVVDPHRGAAPIVRRLGPLRPQQSYLEKIGQKVGGAGVSDDGDEEDLPLNARSLNLRYVEAGFGQIRWKEQLTVHMIGELIQENREDKKELRTWLGQMMEMNMALHRQTQDAEDRKTEREIRLALAKFKVDLMKEGLHTARHLLPGLFGPGAGQGQGSNGAGQGTQGLGNGTGDGQPKLYGFSPEKMLLDGFLRDIEECKEPAGLDVLLFGDWELHEGRMRPIPDKPGIFTPEQCAILFAVRAGALPPEALDVIMPRSGDPRQITEEQAAKAGAVMPASMGTAVLELVALRQRAKAARTAAPSSTPSTGAPEGAAAQE